MEKRRIFRRFFYVYKKIRNFFVKCLRFYGIVVII